MTVENRNPFKKALNAGVMLLAASAGVKAGRPVVPAPAPGRSLDTYSAVSGAPSPSASLTTVSGVAGLRASKNASCRPIGNQGVIAVCQSTDDEAAVFSLDAPARGPGQCTGKSATVIAAGSPADSQRSAATGNILTCSN